MNKVIISAPWGNWLHFPGCTSTLGTFTLKRRGGLLYRLWRCLLTLRYNWRTRSWVNKLGLPNPGIEFLPYYPATKGIVSVHGFDGLEWSGLLIQASPPLRSCAAIELNVSCPNVGHQYLRDNLRYDLKFPIEVHLACHPEQMLIAKLPPVRTMELAETLYEIGIRHFHLCNTLPCKRGGISGKLLKPHSLLAVRAVKQRWGEAVTVIGGGGITSAADVLDYRRAGADHVAIGSMLLNPLNWSRVPAIVEAMK